jgi:hypothetical protein
MSDYAAGTEVFRIDWRRGPLVVMLGGLAALVAASTFASGVTGFLAAFSPLAFGALPAWFFGTVEVGPIGFTLYRINRANWNELTRVKSVSILGLPYLRVWRRAGLPWFVPLYVSGPRPLVQSLAAWAPHASEFAASLQEASNQALQQEGRNAA